MSLMRVATYNVRHCLGIDGRTDPKRIATVLKATGALVIALQELDRGVARSGGRDQPSLLGDLLATEVSFHPIISIGAGAYGIGLAGVGLSGWGEEELPRARASAEARAVMWARRDGITFLCTHLSLDRDGRALQTEALARLVRGLRGPVVLLGDLNQTRRALGPLRHAGLQPGSGRHRTHSSTFPRHQIDWALAGGGARIADSWTLSSRASDHLPLVADLEA